MPIQLNQRQQTTVASAVTILAVFVILAAVGALFWLIAAFLNRFSGVFLPLAVAAVAALVCRPYFDWLRRRLHLPRVAALIAVFLSGLIPLAIFFWVFGSLVVEQVSELLSKVPEWWRAGEALVRERAPQVVDFAKRHHLLDRVEGQKETLVQGLQIFSAGALSAGAGVLRGIGWLLGWAVLPVYFAFFLLAETKPDGGLEKHLPFLKSETRSDVVFLVQEFVNLLVVFFRGQLIVALLQGLLFATGFSIVGLKYGFVLGLVLGFLNIIPYLGSIVGLGVALPLALFQPEGGILLVVWVLVVFTVVQAIEAYLLTPRIMGNRTGLHPVTIIVAIFFWGSALGGIVGMVLAIPLTAFLVVVWRLARDKYVTEVV